MRTRFPHLPRPLVGDSEYDDTAARVGQRDAVFDQLLEMKASSSRLEFDSRSFRSSEVGDEFVVGRHLGLSARGTDSAEHPFGLASETARSRLNSAGLASRG